MEMARLGPSTRGPEGWFTGDVLMESITAAQEPAPHSLTLVHFTPRARTAWHSHSVRQTLYVTRGDGVVQARGQAAHLMRPGDVVRVPAEEWHWHGATADHLMTHLSLAEGKITFGDHVSDQEYATALSQLPGPASDG
jgi:quercetin dioxygenase-like cupin family protein